MRLQDDDREIEQILFPDEGAFRVGQTGVTAIKVSEQPGQCALVPWFDVYKGAEIIHRVNAEHVQIVTYVEIEKAKNGGK